MSNLYPVYQESAPVMIQSHKNLPKHNPENLRNMAHRLSYNHPSYPEEKSPPQSNKARIQQPIKQLNSPPVTANEYKQSPHAMDKRPQTVSPFRRGISKSIKDSYSGFYLNDIQRKNDSEHQQQQMSNKLIQQVIPVQQRLVSSRKKLQFTIKTRAGQNAGQVQQKINQDAYFIAENFCGYPQAALFMILDGHGNYGHIVSNQAQLLLFKQLETYFKEKKLTELTDQVISAGFMMALKDCEIQLMAQGVDMTLSGSTFNSILIVDQNLWCVNLGDSRSILLSQNFGTLYELSHDHKPENSDEKSRIITHGGRVSPVRNQYGAGIGPMRVWARNYQYPGLAMSRSIGDSIAHLVGVITKPDIMFHKIQAGDQYIVMGSDGLFEHLDNIQVSKIVKELQDKNIEYISDTLIQRALSEWQKLDSVDDITCILIKL